MTNTTLTLLSATQTREFYASGLWRDDTIYQLARAHAEHQPAKIAVRERGRAVGYRDLMISADALAADLHQAGLRFGDRVALWLPSRIETAVALLACSRNGYACCPSLHRDHTVAEIVDLVQRMRASALIAEPGYGADADRADVFEAVEAVPSLLRVFRLPTVADSAGELLGASRHEQRPATANADIRTDPNTIVYLAYTSGTTGQPKGVMHSDNTLLGNTRVMSHDWGFDAASVFYSLSPLSHNLGFGAMVMALSNGGELVIHDLPRGASLVDRIVETGVTFVIGVPTHAIDLLADMRARGLKALGSVKGFRVSGAAVPPVVAAGLLECGVVPQAGFGMTEAGSHHYTRRDDDTRAIVETSGRVCRGYDVRVFARDDPDKEVAIGDVGQIGGRGASLMLGYFGDQAATEASFNRTGWFMTGDLGMVDADGYLRITGRKKDVIIRGGHNIFPARIENLVLRHASIDKAAVIAIPDERLGEKVGLAVTLRAGRQVSADELLRHLDATGLSKFDMPEYVMLIDALPLTPSGKVLKRELVAWVEQGKVKPVAVRFVKA